MIHREIDFDEETDRILTEIARDHEGDVGKALAELLQAHQGLEALVEKCEEANEESLRAQVERAACGFREGRFTSWDDVKRRGL